MHLREFLIFPTLLAGTAAAGQVGYIPAFCGSTSSPCPLSTAVVLNLSSNQVTGEISLGGAAPSAMAITPDGTRIYITSGQTVYVVERATHQIVATIPLPLQGIGIAIRPDGRRAYVSAENQSLKSPAVLVIQISSNKLVAGKPLPAFADGIAVTPDSKHVYMALANGSVSILDTATNQVSTIQTGSPLLEEIAITPDGARAYLSGYLSQTSTGVIVLSTATNTVLTTIPIGGQVFGIAVTQDGSKAYVITSVPTGSSPGGSAFVILTSTNQILTSVGVGVSPSWVTITPDGTRDLVTNSNASVSSIDAQSETLAATIRTPGPVGQIAISPTFACV